MTSKLRIERLVQPVSETEAPYRLVIEYLPDGAEENGWMAALALGFSDENECDEALRYLGAIAQTVALAEHA